VPARLFTGTDMATRFSTLPDPPARDPFARARHTDGIETFVLRRDRAMPALALTLLLEALAEHCGARLLRLKGLVSIEEMPGQPAVIHGVQHVFAPPEFLDRWPSADHTTRMVFIAQGVPRHFPARLLDAIEHEVREAMEQSAPPR
jgi:G3E family GTPase